MEWKTVDWENDVEFCPDREDRNGMTSGITTMLGLDLFRSSNLETIMNARYAQMRRNFKNVSYKDYGCPECCDQIVQHLKNIENPNKPDARLNVDEEIVSSGVPEIKDCFSQPNFGHDLPVWLNISNPIRGFKKIMIISEDPKREDGDSGALSLSTPFGVHCATYRQYMRKRDELSLRLIEHLLALYGMVYITDSRKLYAGDKGKYVKEAVKLKDGYLRKCFDHLLEREICEFQPDIILTLGNEVVNVRYTSSILSKAHLPKDGYEVQCIPENGRYINLITAFHPSFSRIKDKSGNVLRAARNYVRLAKVAGMVKDMTVKDIQIAYFEKILQSINDY